ncbi:MULTISPECIES: sugar-binding domain-containing protein [Clostridium]|uniref:Sugar-binding transcriptional regulator n=1 Tax=Clostridium cibarium TaxID=2762247 RepID=A0ABR8PQA7_9CLOT|nr:MULTISPECIES: sugar-binding domain-containing protein [Clostridium]MBD7910343.1 sugar-binding transcriptional regulator [Clostridium cibarium]
MKEILRLQKKIVPELVEVLEKRYNILRTIYYNQPIGRRILANELNLGERIVRTEISLLKAQGLIDINTPGMTVTDSGEEIVNELKDFIHEIKGLSEIESQIKSLLHLRKVIIVPGDVDENPIILKELGKACSNYVKDIIKDNSIIALTGGSTLKEVVEAFPRLNNFSNILVVPARGGMGRKVETQANTLAASFAEKINGSYKMLHIPENLSLDILDSLLKEKEIKEVIDCIHKADILIYGIGNARDMAIKRGAAEEEINRLIDLGAIGEAFGCYFNKDSKVVSQTTPIGINIKEARKINTHIAVAGGKNKVESIISTQRNNTNGILVTDEAAGREILEILKKTMNNLI